VNQRVLAEPLRQQGHHVTIAADGAQALDCLAQDPSIELLLLDLEMPRMDGFEVTAAIRKGEKLCGRHLRIIAVTANTEPADQLRCFEAGMDGFVEKPVRNASLLETIATTLATINPDLHETPVIDYDKALARVGGSPAVLQSLCALFAQGYSGQLDRLEKTMQAKDWSAAVFIAQDVLATINTLHLVRAQNTGEALRKACGAKDAALCAGSLAILRTELAAFARSISSTPAAPALTNG
jgi:CheY-like chemotaxis protein